MRTPRETVGERSDPKWPADMEALSGVCTLADSFGGVGSPGGSGNVSSASGAMDDATEDVRVLMALSSWIPAPYVTVVMDAGVEGAPVELDERARYEPSQPDQVADGSSAVTSARLAFARGVTEISEASGASPDAPSAGTSASAAIFSAPAVISPAALAGAGTGSTLSVDAAS